MQSSRLPYLIARGTMMAVLTASVWAIIYYYLGVTIFTAVLAVLAAGIARFLCFQR